MASNINRVAISGNLTRDAELRSTASGMEVLSIGVAVNDSRKDPQTGEWKDYPNYVDCTMFGTRAGKIAQYLAKGAKVSIDGKLRWSQWEAKDGSKRSKLEVVVNEIEFMSRRDGQPEQYAQPQPAQYQQPAQYAQAPQQYAQQPQAYPQAYQQPAQYAQPQPAAQPAPQPQQYQQPQQQQPAQQAALYDEDIPFDYGHIR